MAEATFPAHDAAAPFIFPREEEVVLQYWREIDAFQESLRQSEGKPEYIFM
jgi:isoleucyl-tRNA synthetase